MLITEAIPIPTLTQTPSSKNWIGSGRLLRYVQSQKTDEALRKKYPAKNMDHFTENLFGGVRGSGSKNIEYLCYLIKHSSGWTLKREFSGTEAAALNKIWFRCKLGQKNGWLWYTREQIEVYMIFNKAFQKDEVAI